MARARQGVDPQGMKRRAIPAEPILDHGAQPWRTVKEDAPDPDNPNATIRRASVYDPLKRLEREGSIETAHVNAAERFRNCLALTQGAREGVGSVRLEPWQRCHYAARVADARAEVRASLQHVGLRLSAVFVAAVVAQQPIKAIAKDLHMGDRRVGDLLREALERLLQWQTEAGV